MSNEKKLKELLEYRYGISLEAYMAQAEKQGGRCAICQQTPKDRLCVDHDHDTGEMRGLLCRHCNSGLGHFKDDPSLLRVALNYLERAHDGRGDAVG